MRNTIHSTMIAVLHTVIRATAAIRPGRAASSLRRKPRRAAPALTVSTPAVMAYHHSGCGTDTNQVIGWIVEQHAHGETLSDDDPFEGLVHRRQSGRAGIGGLHPPTHAVDASFERSIVVGHDP